MTDGTLLAGFPNDEKVAYLGAIAGLATADRAATPDEMEFLDAIAQSADLNQGDMQQIAAVAQDPSPEGLQQHLQTLRDSDLRFSLVADLEAFAASDGSATAEERQRIAQVAQMVGVNPQQHAALSQFVMKAQSASPEEIHQPGFLDRLGLGNILGGSGINTGSLMKGLLAVGGPLLLAKMLSGSRSGSAPRSGGLLGSLLGGAGLAAGASALGGMLGGGGGGGLGSLLGGGNSGGGLGSIFGGNSDDEGQYANQNIPQQSSGGLGSIFQTLTGGGQQGGGGGLGSLLGGLGGLFGGR